MILLIGTSRTKEIQYIKYASEYILKLQIHQHSLLTRNIFSRHNSSTQVFITGSSSKLDHYWIIIITAYAISIKWCYLLILLVTGSYTEPTLFHVGFRPILHVGLHLLQHLYLTMGGTHPTSMLERPAQHLYLTMRGTHLAYMLERLCTYIWPCKEHIHHTC